MKKIILASLAATLALTACDKKPAESATDAKPAETATPANAPADKADVPAAHDHEHEHEHDHDEHEDHDHEAHDHDHEGHDHAHDHHHDAGDRFQCGDKTVQIAVHDHEGEIEAHLTADDITYDLNQDLKDKKRFTTDDGIEGDDKPMTLVVDGNKAQVLKADNSVLLDCTKS